MKQSLSESSPHKRQLVNVLRALIAIALLAAVLWASLSVISFSPTHPWDKLLHFLGYASLMLLLGLLWRRQLIWVCLMLIAFGGVVEYWQGYVPRRSPSIEDFYADALGTVLMCGLMRLVIRIRASS